MHRRLHSHAFTPEASNPTDTYPLTILIKSALLKSRIQGQVLCTNKVTVYTVSRIGVVLSLTNYILKTSGKEVELSYLTQTTHLSLSLILELCHFIEYPSIQVTHTCYRSPARYVCTGMYCMYTGQVSTTHSYNFSCCGTGISL